MRLRLRSLWWFWLLALLVMACGRDSAQIFTPSENAPPPIETPAPQGDPQPVVPIPPLVGPLRAQGGIFHDATGPRRVIGYSDFPALRIFADDPAEAEATLRAAQAAGWQYVRLAFALGETETQNGGYWRGAHVHPDLTKRVLVPFAKLAQRYNIRLHLFGAHDFGSRQQEIAFIHWMAQTLAEEGLAETVALFEWRNEYLITSPWRGTDNYAIARESIDVWRRYIRSPVTMGSPGEDDDVIAETIQFTGADVAAIDLNRGMPGDLLMKHAHRVYYAGRYGGKYRGAALFATEPTGPNGVGGDVYLPLDDPAFVYGLAATYASTGQAFTYFNGAAVRHRRPIDSVWGFYELPRLLAHIPEDIGTYEGPSWFTKGSTFVTVLAEGWGMHTAPPRPIKSWSLVTLSGLAITGTGPITATGWKAAIVKGEWQ